MSLYTNNVTIGGLVPLPGLTVEAIVPVFYNGSAYRVTVGNLLAQVNKATLGISNVDNTADANKPISAPVAVALATKADTVHQHPTSQVTGLDAALSQRALLSHTHSIGEVSGLQAALADTAFKVHGHEIADVNGLTASLAAKVNSSTVLAQMATKAEAAHTHQASDIIGLPVILADAATRTFVTDSIAAAPVRAHTHQIADVVGLSTVLNSKADSVTVNTISSQITALQNFDTFINNALIATDNRVNGKATIEHTHQIGEILNLPQTLQLMQQNIDALTLGSGGVSIVAVQSFNTATRALVVLMSDNSTVSLDMTELINHISGTVMPPIIDSAITASIEASSVIYQVPNDTATFTPDYRTNRNISWTLNSNGVLGDPTDFISGRSGSIFIVQGTGGSRSLTFGPAYSAAGGIGSLPQLSTDVGAVDRIDYIVFAANNVQISITKDIKA